MVFGDLLCTMKFVLSAMVLVSGTVPYMYCEQTKLLLNEDYLTVWNQYFDPGDYWLQENQTSLRDDRVELQCAKSPFEQDDSYSNRQLYLRALSVDKFTFLYGSVEAYAKAPTEGYDVAEIGLQSTRCTLSDCSAALNTRSVGFAFSKDSPAGSVTCMISYVDPVANQETRADTRLYYFPHGTEGALHHYKIIWSQKFVTCLVDGYVVANFTNQLALPKGKHFLALGVFCSVGSARDAVTTSNTFILSNITYVHPHYVPSSEDEQDEPPPVPATWVEHWLDHSETLRLLGYDDDVAVYFDEMVGYEDTGFFYTASDWISEYVSETWRYVNQHYGPLHLKGDSRFYAIFHVGKHRGCHVADQLDPSHDFRNVMNCGSTDRQSWGRSGDKGHRVLVRNYTSWAATYFAVTFAKETYGDPMHPFDQSALRYLIQYDIHLAENETELAKNLLSANWLTMNNHIYWLRDWYYPIYTKYGGTGVIEKYFALLSKNLPSEIDSKGGLKYTRTFRNLGECVHFWSGAANTSLRSLARTAFGWTLEDERNLKLAQSEFPQICYLQETNSTFSIPFDESDTNSVSNGGTKVSVTAPAVVIPLGLVIAVVVGWCWHKIRRRSRNQAKSMRLIAMKPYSTVGSAADHALTNLGKDYGFKFGDDIRPFVLPKSQLQRSVVVLGRGEFGTVYAGIATGLYGITGSVPVAAKVLNSRVDGNDETSKRLFVQEVNIMIRVGQHLNLANLMGVVFDEYPTLLIELCEMGSLLSRLQDCRSKPGKFSNLLDLNGNLAATTDGSFVRPGQTANPADNESPYQVRDEPQSDFATTDLLSFSYQISRGLDYLSSRNVVHRDIAARNILLAKNKVAKVSDFGMARWSEKNYMLASSGTATLPVRWMAPEAIATLSFNQSTDVWSYGVVLWEIFSLGLVPYSHVPMAGKVVQFGEWLAAGNCMDKPLYSPNNVYAIMLWCWTVDAAERPNFRDLKTKFEDILSNEVADYYTELDQPYQQFNTENASEKPDELPVAS